MCLQEGAVTLLSGGVAVALRSEAWSGELSQFGLRRLAGGGALGLPQEHTQCRCTMWDRLLL